MTDAPITVGQPEYVGPVENLPRSPHGRVLPQTPATRKEPGMWAVDGPKASKKEPLDIFGFYAPVPDEAQVLEEIASPIWLCSAYVRMTAYGKRKSPEIMRMPDAIRWCLAARLYHACIDRRIGRLEGMDGGEPAMRKMTTAILEAANTFEQSACSEDTMKATKKMYDSLLDAVLEEEAR
jgi:hypothetical protein